MKKYNFKYRRLFVRISMLVAVLLALLMSMILFSNRYNLRYNLANIEAAQSANKLSQTLKLSRQMINNLRYSQEADDWANATSLPEERYAMYMLKKTLDNQYAWLQDDSFTVGMWRIDSDTEMAFYDKGTYTLELLCSSILHMSEEDLNECINIVQRTGEYLIPEEMTQDEENQFILFGQTYGTSNIIYFVSIPDKSFNIANESFIITYGDTVINTNIHDDDLVEAAMHSTGNIWKNGLVRAISKSVGDGGLNYIYLTTIMDIKQLLIPVVFFLACSILLSLSFSILSQKIYAPIESLLNELMINNGNDEKVIDEFKLLKSNVLELKLINGRMKETISKISVQSKEQAYRSYLFGVRDIEFNDKLEDFILVVFEMAKGLDSSEIFTNKTEIKSLMQDNSKMLAVDLPDERIAILLKTNLYEEAEDFSALVIDQIFADEKCIAAISNIHSGKNELHVAYCEATKTIESRYLFEGKNILSYNSCPKEKIEEYHYPIALEYKLIHAVLNCDDSAIQIFDELTRENFRNQDVSPKMTENYVLALINTVNRIFSELKLTPLQLLGKDIDFVQWTKECNESTIIYEVRDTIDDIISALKARHDTKQNEIIDNMLEYIHSNYMKDIMLNDIASWLGMSPQKCSTLFKEITHENFKNYLNTYRIEKAIEIQKEDSTIQTNELAELVGFNSANSFIRAYKKHVGMSPQLYMQNLLRESVNATG